MAYGRDSFMTPVETYGVCEKREGRKGVNFRTIRYRSERGTEYVAVQKFEDQDGRGGAWLLDTEVPDVIAQLAKSVGLKVTVTKPRRKTA